MTTNTMKPQFTNQVNLGHLLQIVTILLTIGGGWLVLEGRSRANEEVVSSLVDKQTALDTEVGDLREQLTSLVNDNVDSLNVRVRYLEQEMVRAGERYSSLQEVLTRMDKRLERWEQDQRGARN